MAQTSPKKEFAAQECATPKKSVTNLSGVRFERSVSAHKMAALSCGLSADGGRFVTSSRDKTLKIWDAKTGKEIATVKESSPIQASDISPCGKLVVGAVGPVLKLWEARTGKLLGTMEGHKGKVSRVRFSPTGKHLVSTGADASIKVWEVEKRKLLSNMKGHQHGTVTSVSFSPDGTQVVSGGEDKTVRTWRWQSRELVTVLAGHAEDVWDVAWDPTGTLVASASRDSTVRIWHPASERCLHVLTGHQKPVYSVAFLPDGSVVSGSQEGGIRVWGSDGQCTDVFRRHQGAVCQCITQASSLISCGQDGTLKMWSASLPLHGSVRSVSSCGLSDGSEEK
eukprot:Hpha_TRINITY_DN16156_c5_g5::TRINITY_DN16156_c5_g5_i1::g.3497::m.3497